MMVQREDYIYIIPTEDKPVKMIFDARPCPIAVQLGMNYHCEHSYINHDDGSDIDIQCDKIGCKECIFKLSKVIDKVER